MKYVDEISLAIKDAMIDEVIRRNAKLQDENVKLRNRIAKLESMLKRINIISEVDKDEI